jgi:hypothetical protein
MDEATMEVGLFLFGIAALLLTAFIWVLLWFFEVVLKRPILRPDPDEEDATDEDLDPDDFAAPEGAKVATRATLQTDGRTGTDGDGRLPNAVRPEITLLDTLSQLDRTKDGAVEILLRLGWSTTSIRTVIAGSNESIAAMVASAQQRISGGKVSAEPVAALPTEQRLVPVKVGGVNAGYIDLNAS